MAESYPLYWPEGWKRSRHRIRSKFKTGFGAARNLLLAELSRMGATRIILSTSIPLRNDGLPRANVRPDGGDTGVAVYFYRKDKQMVFACDKYDRSEDNIYAIAKTIDAMRGIERWGASDMMERAFSGFKQLSATSGEEENPWQVLGLGDRRGTTTRESIVSAHRLLSQTAHPDKGGSSDQMARINIARDKCLREVGEGER